MVGVPAWDALAGGVLVNQVLEQRRFAGAAGAVNNDTLRPTFLKVAIECCVEHAHLFFAPDQIGGCAVGQKRVGRRASAAWA
jgi:hypothetical protein